MFWNLIIAIFSYVIAYKFIDPDTFLGWVGVFFAGGFISIILVFIDAALFSRGFWSKK